MHTSTVSQALNVMLVNDDGVLFAGLRTFVNASTGNAFSMWLAEEEKHAGHEKMHFLGD